MTRRSQMRIALAVGMVVAVAILGFVFRGPLLERIAPRAVMTSTGTALIGGPFALVDQTGATRTDADFRGKFMLVYFGYTYCPDVCPTTLQTMTEALERLGKAAARVQPIFITIDPARDTPKVMGQYVAHFYPGMIGLTGTAAQIAAAARAYRVYYAKEAGRDQDYLMDHSGFVYLMGPDGKYITIMPPQVTAGQMAAVLAKHLGG